MSPATLQFILMALQALPSLITAGSDIASEVSTLQSQIKLFVSENRDPTAAEWATQNADLVSALTNLQKAKPAA